MLEWMSIQDGTFIAADVIRWTEGVYKPRQSRKAKSLRFGEWRVTAEVLQGADEKGWVRFLVRKCEILFALSLKMRPPFSLEREITRAKKTIVRGMPERLLWSNESARVMLASEFLGSRQQRRNNFIH